LNSLMKPQSMEALRREIDTVDRQIIHLLKKRADLIDRAVDLKLKARLPARIDSRVEEVVANVCAQAQELGLAPDLVEEIWRKLIDWSICHEEKTLGKGHI